MTESLTVSAPALVAALKNLKRVIANNRLSSVPILSAVAFRRDVQGGVVVVATDLDTELAIALPGARLDGTMVLPLTSLLAGLDGETGAVDITICDEDGDLTADINVGGFAFKLTAYNYTDFPAPLMRDASGDTASAVLDAGALGEALRAVQVAVSTEETRYYLCGVYIHAAPAADASGQLRMTATDGHKLMWATFPSVKWGGPGLILPATALGYLLPMLKDDGRPVLMRSRGQVYLMFATDEWTLSTKVIDGTFPDYTRVIPTQHMNHVTLRSADVIKACAKLGKLSDERSRPVALDVPGRCVRMVGVDTVKTASVGMAMTDMRGNPDVVGFNSAYLVKMFAHMGEKARMSVGGSGDPALFVPMRQPDGYDLGAVLMPMRV